MASPVPRRDTLGYSIRKKKSALLRAQKDKFVQQAAERGVAPNVIDAVFKAFEPFERYGFNKAHATCYGLIAYQTAYLKANYTVEYMTSVLTAMRDSTDKVAAAIAECRRMGIEVLPPDVHKSGLDFTVEEDAIRFGLLAIKNVGHGAIESIVASRNEDGQFRSLADFCTRIDLRLVNRRVLESLIRVGALNALGHPAQLLMALDDALSAGQAAQRDRLTGQVSLFDSSSDSGPLERPLPEEITEAVPRERLRWEKELLGLYLSDHPLGELAGTIGEYVNAYSGEMGEELDQQRVVIGGVVTEVRRVITKARATMGVATLEDLQGTIEVIVFPKVFELTEQTWAEDSILLVCGSGRPQGRRDGPPGRHRLDLGAGDGARCAGIWARGGARRSRAAWRLIVRAATDVATETATATRTGTVQWPGRAGRTGPRRSGRIVRRWSSGGWPGPAKSGPRSHGYGAARLAAPRRRGGRNT